MNFKIEKRKKHSLARAGVLETPHGLIETPAFVAVGTKATVKAVTPEQLRELGAQVVLANTYHLYLQPGAERIAKAGGLGKFMNWPGPTMTDSGGFQVFSLGAAFGKGTGKIATANPREFFPLHPSPQGGVGSDEIKNSRGSLSQNLPPAKINEDGVTFRSHLDGSEHRFTPEKSIEIQQKIGADIIFAFDECTASDASYEYQKEAMARTHHWAERSLEKFKNISPTPALPQGEGVPKFLTADKRNYIELQDKTLEMRRNPTKAEDILWQKLNNHSTGFHFRRQHIIGNFIVDFVCLRKLLIIEIDGDIHDYQKERDCERTNFLEQNGFKVIRFRNEEIINNSNKVLSEIIRILKTLPLGEGLGGASQQLFGIVQGGRHEDLRKKSAREISKLDFTGFGIGGSFEKKDIATAVRWVNEILPEEKPRHLLGIGEPADLIAAIENGCDLFDCVAPTRMARNGALYTQRGRINITNAKFADDFLPIQKDCGCYTCQNFTRAYLAHLFRAKEMLAATLASIHNLHFIINLVKTERQKILEGR